MVQVKAYKEKKTKKSKAKTCLFTTMSLMIFTRIMFLKTTKAIWDYLKEEYVGDKRIKGMQVLNLIREFELQKINESKAIKDYSDKLLSIANKVRLLDSEVNDSRIVEKIFVMVPERYETTITTLENTKDLSKISLEELLNSLQAQKKRRLMSQNVIIERASKAKHHKVDKNKKKKKKGQEEYNDFTTSSSNTSINGNFKGKYPPY
ncbi:hypothetical protein CK203_102087 [Vitis vinifera]|uniref:Retrovirus-related Pol polyprotein from transposon TNT 1-94 n=1 Tax=Vitis vinifera TaxID=29760 RepID=A0A438EJV1_VITVI|nr:hypothetical protein CK203_102087 [Vitis vinifera]